MVRIDPGLAKGIRVRWAITAKVAKWALGRSAIALTTAGRWRTNRARRAKSRGKTSGQKFLLPMLTGSTFSTCVLSKHVGDSGDGSIHRRSEYLRDGGLPVPDHLHSAARYAEWWQRRILLQDSIRRRHERAALVGSEARTTGLGTPAVLQGHKYDRRGLPDTKERQ